MQDIIRFLIGNHLLVYLGSRTRFYILQLFGKDPDIRVLEGNTDENSGANYVYTLLMGFTVLILLIFLIGYILLALDSKDN